MLIPTAALMAGVCIGVTSAAARVPYVRLLAAVCAGALTALGALALIVLDSSNIVLALGFIVSVVISSSAYGSWLWSRDLAPDSPGFGWLFVMELFRPGRVRKVYRARQADETAV